MDIVQTPTKEDLPPLIAVVGPTAVGKTVYAIDMAQRIGGEIVSADSRQIYRQMDIGTAKPTLAQRQAVPHYLVDSVEPDEPFTLAVYQEQAMQIIADITARGKVPMLVGGTGQYLACVLQGWNIPRVEPQPEFRRQLEEAVATHGTAHLYARLDEVDRAAAQKIDPNNVRRIIRALEVHHVTGRPISEQQTHTPPPYKMTTYWLTMPSNALYARIDDRVDAMMKAGLLAEVETLVNKSYRWQLPAMSSLGYIQFRPYFENTMGLEECVQRLKFDTHAFARRQKNWFRRLPGLVEQAQ